MSCTCKKCEYCNGTGDIYVSISGDFVGSHHWDDLDTLEPCPFCNGTGFEEMCDECMEKEFEDYESEFMEDNMEMEG